MNKKELNKVIKMLEAAKLLADNYRIRHDDENNVFVLYNDGVLISNIEAATNYIRDIRFYEDVYQNTK